MTRIRSALILCVLAVGACSSPEAPSGILSGTWFWRGPVMPNTTFDSTHSYFTLALTHAGSQVGGTMQFCVPSECGRQDVSGPYADSSVTFDLGLVSFVFPPTSSSVVRASLSGRLVSTDTLIGVLTNFSQPSTDTLVFVRTAGQSAGAP